MASFYCYTAAHRQFTVKATAIKTNDKPIGIYFLTYFMVNGDDFEITNPSGIHCKAFEKTDIWVAVFPK